MLRNKRAMEKILGIYWFAVLVIVAGAVVGMVVMAYSIGFDVRSVESDFMIQKISRCIAEGGFLKIDLENFQGDLLQECGMYFGEIPEDSEYFVAIDWYEKAEWEGKSPSDITKSNKRITAGRGSLEDIGCQNNIGGNAPYCRSGWFYVLQEGEEQKQLMVKITAAVNKVEENA